VEAISASSLILQILYPWFLLPAEIAAERQREHQNVAMIRHRSIRPSLAKTPTWVQLDVGDVVGVSLVIWDPCVRPSHPLRPTSIPENLPRMLLPPQSEDLIHQKCSIVSPCSSLMGMMENSLAVLLLKIPPSMILQLQLLIVIVDRNPLV
jgi:hypothetical protein